MECRTLFSSVPMVASATAEVAIPSPLIVAPPEEWFPSRHMDARFYDRLLDLAHGSDAELRNLYEGATVRSDRTHAAGYEVEEETDGEE